MADYLTQIEAAVYDGDEDLVVELVEKALADGVDPEAIIQDGGVAALNRLGDDFNNMMAFLPELMIGGEFMKKLIEMCSPHLKGGKSAFKGKIVIGCAKGDLHDIGKSLVKMMMEGKGLEVIDLGVDVAPEAFVQAAMEHNANLIGCSALLTTTMPVMGEVVKAAEVAGIWDKVKIMIGGAPVSQEFCDSIGADAYTPDAATAAIRACELLAQ